MKDRLCQQHTVSLSPPASPSTLNVPIVVLALVGSAHGIVTQRPIALWLSPLLFPPVLLFLTLLTPFHYVANRYAFITLTSWIVLAAAALDSMVTALQNRQTATFAVVGG